MNEDALVKIFDLYSSALYKYALSLCYDPVTADHIVGDVFAKLLEQFASVEGPKDNLRSYLYQAVYHRIIDEIRFPAIRRKNGLVTLPAIARECYEKTSAEHSRCDPAYT